MNIKKKMIVQDVSFSKAVDAYIPLYDYVSLNDAEGNASVPKTAVNSRVSEGQVLGKHDAYSASVHAPVPGVLTEYKTLTMPNGKKSEVAVIRLDGEFSYKGKRLRMHNWDNLSAIDICSILADNGVINTFDTPCSIAREILSFSDNKKGEAILSLRLFDADPSVCTDSFIASQKLNEVLEGAAVVGKALCAAKIFVLHDKTLKKPENVLFKNMEFVKVPAARQLMCGKR